MVLLVIVVLIWWWNNQRPDSISQNSPQGTVEWQFIDQQWQPSSTPPACPEPLEFPAPIDVSLVSGMIYPGQIRGTDFKAHGGFRFDSLGHNQVEVRAIMDGYVTKAARYEQGGEVQYFFFYVNDCGIMVMNDHLKKPVPKLQEMFDQLPLGANGDSRTTEPQPRVFIEKGELLATEIGFSDNVFLDLGVYDLRQQNAVEFSEDFARQHPSIDEYGRNALCWLDYLESADRQVVQALPAGGIEGKTSMYCE